MEDWDYPDQDDDNLTLGTTTAGIVLDELVILGADRKGTDYDEYGREIIEEKDKVYELVSGLPFGVTRAGSERHSDHMITKLRNIVSANPIRGRCNIRMLARQAFEDIEANKGKPDGLRANHQGDVLLGGFDPKGKPCLIYMNNSVCMDLTRTDIPEINGHFHTGSGSASIFLNTNSYEKGMSEEAGIKYMQRLIYNSIVHDNHSGLGIDVLVIRPTGCATVNHISVKEYEAIGDV